MPALQATASTTAVTPSRRMRAVRTSGRLAGGHRHSAWAASDATSQAAASTVRRWLDSGNPIAYPAITVSTATRAAR